MKRTGVVGHKSLRTKRLVVESLSGIETSNFKALLTYHSLIIDPTYFLATYYLISKKNLLQWKKHA